jgi:GH25 family lysozyme M1 (1,4-beta-N-acetylmuramidase)
VRGFPFAAIGYYQYLESARDAAQQAREFAAAVGDLRSNEFVVLDHEEGSGNQRPRAQAWFAVVDARYGFRATLYAGRYFCNTNLGGWASWAGRPRWLAAYQSVEPPDPHELWQNTDKARFPGLAGAVDGNLFHGTDQEFLGKMRPGAQAPTPPPERRLPAFLMGGQSD